MSVETKDELDRPPSSQAIEWATDEEKEQIWDDFETFWVGSSNNGGRGNLHLFEYCSTIRGRTDKKKEKDVACYPIGFKEPCRNCVHLWRHNEIEEVREVLSRYADE
jgi:hypothetical protein